MVSIRLLGGFSCSVNGAALARLGPKLQGLIALLAMSRGAAVPRTRLAGLLWGERDEKHAHHNLSQALTTIRAALGADAAALEASPDGVWLTTGGFDLDVNAFEQAARSDDSVALLEALQLYRGEFLQGLEIREAGFEEWQLSERYRLGELAAGAFARLLDRQTAAGEVEAAIETARRLIGIAPLNEAAHARLITLYASLGRTALVESHYQHCSDLLRRDLGQAPGEVLQSAYAAARRAAPSQGTSPISAPTLRDSSGTAVGGPRLARWIRNPWVIMALAGGLLLLAGIWSFDTSRVDTKGRSYRNAPWDIPAAPSIAVLPFANQVGDEQRIYFASGITRDIITDLSKFSSLFVIASNSTARYQSGVVDVSKIARELRVRYVLEGTVQRSDNRIRIHAFLTDATTGRHIWAERFEGPDEELFTVQKRIAQTIAGLLASKSGEIQRAEFERIRAMPTEDLRAYELYVRGVEHQRRRTKEDNALARELFRKAMEADPNYARAMAECALTYLADIFQGWSDSREDALRQAHALAQRAIEVDASEEWGFAALAFVYQLSRRNDDALKLLERAHSLNPNDYGIRQALGYAVTFTGAAERGVDLLELSERLDPYHTTPSYLAIAYFFARRYEDVLARLSQYPELHATRTFWLYRAAAYAELDRIDEAREAVGKALKLDATLTVQGERARRLQLGLAPAYADHLSAALRKAGLPEG